MKAALGLATLAIFANASPGEDSNTPELGLEIRPKDIFPGSYEFEIMGTPMRLYLCQNDDDKSTYWSTVKLNSEWTNEYTEVVGRDKNGFQFDGKHTYTLECDIFRLYGDRHLQGYYKLVFDAKVGEYHLYERYPELEDGQTGAQDEKLWNAYELTKISFSVVGNPRLAGMQCLHPQGATISLVPIPSLWRSQLSSDDDRFLDYIQVSEDPVNSCWKYDDVYGNTHLFGSLYAPEFEWDGSLLLNRWDDFTNPDKCYVGSMFVVMLDADLALISYQCENGITGRQMLMHLEDYADQEHCPYEPEVWAELTTREREIHNLDK